MTVDLERELVTGDALIRFELSLSLVPFRTLCCPPCARALPLSWVHWKPEIEQKEVARHVSSDGDDLDGPCFGEREVRVERGEEAAERDSRAEEEQHGEVA